MKVPLSIILPGQASGACCCTCASVLSEVPTHDAQTEKPYPADREVNPRFALYCPYCQIASDASSNPLPQGLREPPPYDTTTRRTPAETTTKPSYTEDAPPPPYTPGPHQEQQEQDPKPTTTTKKEKEGKEATPQQQQQQQQQDTLHFVHPTDDSIPSLSLRYNVPAPVLRRHNNLTSDHLLPARRTLLIPGSHYPSGVSLSPRPPGGEELEARRAKVRRWMVACRCADYDVAELYLAQGGYDLDLAVGRFLDDERWEREHPLEAGRGNGKGKARDKGREVGEAGKVGTGRTWAAQAAFLMRRQ